MLQQSQSLEYEPSSEPLHVPAKQWFFNSAQVVADSIQRVRTAVADNASGPKAVVKELDKFPFLVETQVLIWKHV